MSAPLPGGLTAEPTPLGQAGGSRPGPAARLALAVIGFYKRRLSPLLPPMCRFTPTCSQYAAEAIGRYGLWRGGWLGARRLLRCNPLFPGGFDPVP
jgi:hypothetical protein